MNITNRKLGNMAPSEPSYSTTASHGFFHTSEKDDDLNTKSHLMVLIEDFINYIYISLKRA